MAGLPRGDPEDGPVRSILPLALLLAAAAPAQGQSAQGQPTQAQTGPIRIGLSAPLTGPEAAFGQGLRLGAEQAVADLNRAGGVGGRKLALVVADDAGDPKQGLAVARRFAGERIGLVVGPLDSAVAATAAPAYEAAGAVMVTPGATWTPLTARGLWNVFRLGASDAQQAAAAAAFLATRYPGRRIGIVHDRSSFGRALADEVSRGLKARGQPEVAFEGLARGSRDAADIAARLKAAGVDIVYFGGFAPEAGVLVRGLQEASAWVPLVASDAILDKDFPQAAGPGAEGTVMTMPGEPRRLPDPPRGTKAAPRTPEAEAVAAQAYAAVEVLAQGVDRARSTEGRKVAEALHAGTGLRTVLGEIGFDARGERTRPDIVLRAWRRTPDGRIDYAGNDVGP
ncbi:branched-chain amino acid ABC transporter substrate-binding protein [Methylobacterium sp. A54F]